MRPVSKILLLVSLVACLVTLPVVAQDCAEDVLKNLFGQLESIDTQGENQLAAAISQLAEQKEWDAAQRSEFTLAIADSPKVDEAESKRTDLLAKLFASVQRGERDCATIEGMRDEILAVEQAQWDAALQQVNSQIWH